MLSVELQDLMDLLCHLSKVTGYKQVIKYFPHEVSDLERVVFLLLWQRDLSGSWKTKYIFLLWLSVIILVPFDLETIDSAIF